jgi:hypothetical protein
LKTNAAVTLYNKYGGENYQRTVIERVHWENRKAVNVIASGGNIQADAVLVLVPEDEGANYLKPKAWAASRNGKWTLKPGDVMVRGVVTDEISPTFTISKLKEKYDDVVTISSVDSMDMARRGSHWMVSAK